MSSVTDFTFKNLTRLGDDFGTLSQDHIQNTQYSNYVTTNHFARDCDLQKAMNLGLSQPSMYYNGGFGNSGAGGCNIDSDSKLRVGAVQTNPKSRITLTERPFLTVPYLGRGVNNPMLESKIQQGDRFSKRKTEVMSSESSNIDYTYVPMIPSLKATVTNPNNLIEDVAAKGWVRGGLPSRDMNKKNCN